MTVSPHIDPDSPDFPGDSSPQPPFGVVDSLRSLAIWSVGVPHLAAWVGLIVGISKVADVRKVDRALKVMAKAVPRLCGVRVDVIGQNNLPPGESFVYVINHVNIFDMFAIYQAIPGYTRSLELAEHFSWPLFGPFITAIGQIPVEPKDKKVTARGLKKASDMLKAGDSLVVLPEGQRTLDGTVGHFYPGAFRLAISAGVRVVPMAIHGGRTVSRRGDWRVRPGKMSVIFGEPISTEGWNVKDAQQLADETRLKVIRLLQNRR